jgi:hypothetical protein
MSNKINYELEKKKTKWSLNIIKSIMNILKSKEQ